MTVQGYTTPFGLTSQFAFCALPLRLDSYRGCSFRCAYCFARYRGGNAPKGDVLPANPRSIDRVFERALGSHNAKLGIIGQFLRRRVPIHFGGMSDPFQPAENHFRVTESVLKTIAHYQYPTVMSTRGSLVGSNRYISLLRRIQALVVQFSFSSTSDTIAKRLEPRCDPPSALLRVMELLARNGIHVTCRWQPYVPEVSEEPKEFVERVASTGCRHLALEHLKLPLEHRNPLWQELARGARRDLRVDYKQLGAVRDGREYVLPPHQKLARVLDVAKCVRAHGMTFGAADNEFQYLSDTGACCSGIDQFKGFENYFRHQIGYAVRKCKGKSIRYSEIAKEWSPEGSIDRYLNSHCRLARGTSLRGSIRDHILARWNSPSAPNSPCAFHGVVPAGSAKWSRNQLYVWSDAR